MDRFYVLRTELASNPPSRARQAPMESMAASVVSGSAPPRPSSKEATKTGVSSHARKTKGNHFCVCVCKRDSVRERGSVLENVKESVCVRMWEVNEREDIESD